MAFDAENVTGHSTAAARALTGITSAASAAAARCAAVIGPVVAKLGRTAPARYVSGSLLRRILVSNLLGLLVLLGGVLYLTTTHGWLLEAKRQSLQKQGQIIASAIGENSRIESFPGSAGEDEASSAVPATRVPFRDDGFAALELSLDPVRVTPILNRIIKPTDARARIYDRTGNLVVDTATLLHKGREGSHVARPDPPPADTARPRTRNVWTKLTQWLIDGELPVYKEIGNANGTAYPEVSRALNGESTAVLLLDNRGEQIVAIAEPIRRAKSRVVQGVLFLSTRPGEISEILGEERSVIWTLACFALLATLLSSWLLAQTVAEPMRRLSAAAEHVSRNISASKELPEDADRKDEVGQMASAFRAMTASLFKRIEASEKFAADVAHELKNPLAAARSTAEAMAYAKTDEQRAQLAGQIQGELKRLNRLITDVSNASRLDAELARQTMQPLDVRVVLNNVSAIFSEIHASDSRKLRVAVEPAADARDYTVDGHEGRLAQVVTNLVDNAISFSPEGGVVTVAARRNGGSVEISVSDQGPGIPEDRLEEIFQRFYSDRPETDQKRGKNSGLGLSISREIVQAHQGRIRAENIFATDTPHPGKAVSSAAIKPLGARFVVDLPAAVSTPRTGGGVGRRT